MSDDEGDEGRDGKLARNRPHVGRHRKCLLGHLQRDEEGNSAPA